MLSANQRRALTVAALCGVALFLRVYDLRLFAWLPDTYDRLTDAILIAHGQLPQSTIYPPGVALIMAPFVAAFGGSLETMQAVTVAAGVGLVLVAYLLTWRLTRNELTAALFAALVATGPLFLTLSRDARYDTLSTLLVVTALIVAGRLPAGMSPAFVGYGVLLAVLVNIRSSNVAVVPAAVAYWVGTQVGWRPSMMVRRLASVPVLAVFVVMAGLTALSAITGEWLGASGTSGATMSAFLPNLAYYAGVLAYGPLAIFTVPLAIAGAIRLWRLDQPLLVATLLLLALWPAAHSAVIFHASRYMLPASFFFFLLVALGAEEMWSWRWQGRSFTAKSGGVYASLAVIALVLVFGATGVSVLQHWPKAASQSDSGMLAETNPRVSALPANSLVISAVARGISDQSSRIQLLDLIDHSRRNAGTGPDSTRALNGTIAAALAQGEPVYYLYTHWEAGEDFDGAGRDGYQRYFDAVTRDFSVHAIFEGRTLRLGRYPWLLYEISSRNGSSLPEPVPGAARP